ncbi:MAG: sporulation protein YabP [Ruminococcaceae bacterium]|nr:sporulation protein YabP [Oscillospiraceae bacterium]
MPMEELGNGRLTMEGRRKLTLTGAKEVVRFNEELVELNTELGAVLIEGAELKLKCLSLDTGTVVVEGKLRSFAYEEAKPKRGLWR